MKSLKGLEKKYQRELNKLGVALANAIRTEILPLLKAEESGYTIDGVATNVNRVFNQLSQRFESGIVANFAQVSASSMVYAGNEKNKARFERSIESATGVNISGVIAEEGLEEFMNASVNKNVSLIKSLPQEYLKSVETIVNNGMINGTKYAEIAKQITAKTGSANKKLSNRIKTIARNEVSTLNAQLSQRRAASLGVKKGIFRTSQDERVRSCHAELNGVEYELTKGAWSKSCGKHIIPGVTDINCRCTFSPVIEVD